jgi:hypothetical protein
MKKVLAVVLCLGVGVAMAGMARAEGDAGGGRHHGKGPHDRIDRFQKADTNKDGKLSVDEFKTLYTKDDAEAKFKAADTDNDGFLTPAELKAAHQERKANQGAAPAPTAPAPKVDQPEQK